jgi:hypothetical protein
LRDHGKEHFLPNQCDALNRSAFVIHVNSWLLSGGSLAVAGGSLAAVRPLAGLYLAISGRYYILTDKASMASAGTPTVNGFIPVLL